MFEPLGVIGPAAHPIKVLRNDRVIGIWQLKPIDGLLAIVTGSRCYTEADLGPSAPELLYVWQISYDDIGPRCPGWHFGVCCPAQGWHHDGFGFSTNKLRDLDRLHHRADGNFSRDYAGG